MRHPGPLRELLVGIAYIALLLILAAFDPGFFRPSHLRTYLVGNASLLVAALGTMLVVQTRQIDISVGSQFAIAGVAAGLLSRTGLPIGAVVPLTVAIGAGMGAINGALVAIAGLPSIVATLATLVIGREGLRFALEGAFVRDLGADFQWFGLTQGGGTWSILAAAVAVVGLGGAFLTRTNPGRALYAVGSDPEGARLLGLGPGRVTFAAFVACGALTALASLLSAVRFVEVDPNAGNGLELGLIAAVVVGGTSINGGRGTVLGTVLGVLLLYAIGPALVFLGFEPQWERAIQGLVILLAVSIDAFGRRRPPR